MSQVRIAGVSDVSIGYGSPQIQAFMHSLVEFYGQSKAKLFEPDQPEKAPVHDVSPLVQVERVRTKIHPHGTLGRAEYITRVTPVVDDFAPDVLVIFCSYSLPVLFKLKRRPRFVIYYAYEQPSAYGPLDVEMNSQIEGLVDLIIFPEDNRAVLDIQTCGYRDIPTVIMYNCANPCETKQILPSSARNGRMIYQGTIDKVRTFASYYYDPALGNFPIDMFGPVSGPDREETRARLAAGPNGVRYMGLVDSRMLAQLRSSYAYSIISWRPDNDNQLYACPNKFFEGIADGVPPITAPHPQTRMFVQKYQCGIVMEDWSLDSFRDALTRARRLLGTSGYDRMVENCKEAVQAELNWNAQFAKVVPFLSK